MPVISNAIVRATLHSGNGAVYELAPRFMDLDGWSLNEAAIQFGRQLAHEKDGCWYKPGGWEEITDPRICALLERALPAVQ